MGVDERNESGAQQLQLQPAARMERSLSTSSLAQRRSAAPLTIMALSPSQKSKATAMSPMLGRCICGRSHSPSHNSNARKAPTLAAALYTVKRDDLRCSICFDILCFPVTLPCGHNFDRGCILAAWHYDAPVGRPAISSPLLLSPPRNARGGVFDAAFDSTDDAAAAAPSPRRQPLHVQACPLCRQIAGIASVNDLHVNLLLKDVIASLYPIETASATTREKQLAAARVAPIAIVATVPTRPRRSLRAISSFAYVCVASVTDPPGFVLAVLLLLALLAIACNPQQGLAVGANNASAAAATLTLMDVLDRVVSVFGLLIREFSHTLEQLEQLRPWIRAFSFVM